MKLVSPLAIEVAIAAHEYHTTDKLRPRRVPSTSTARPASVCPTVYATRNPISTHAKSVFVHWNSVFRYGASTLSV